MAGKMYTDLTYDSNDDEDAAEIPRFNYLEQQQQDKHQRYQYVNSERDLVLPLQKHKNVQPLYESPDEISMRKYIGVSVGMVSLITENLLSHPFVVLRRQCQVNISNNSSSKYHLVPVTLVPIIVHLHQRQGVTTLWKGLGSCLLVRGMSLSIEDAFTKFTTWPKEVNSNTTLKQFGQHILLKCISMTVVLPFYLASLVETVQSDIASEKPGIFDVFREGFCRLLAWSAPQKGRMIPVWALVGPTLTLGLSKYIFGLTIRGATARVMTYRLRHAQEKRGARSRDIEAEKQDIEIYSTLLSVMTTEVIFYPFETILHRIQLQGTRTIIDNLDDGYSVVPILTSYEGAIDCYRTTVASGGISSLYRGFGAMILQFVAHVAVIKLTKWIVTQITEICSSKPPQKVAEFYNLEPRHSLESTTFTRSISSLSIE
ncbi:Mitochondrial outer membrane protein SLC25A46 [Pseudolycoriella hygida]|uniref:Mitochondrial outer membrane protein SLC25A46 n=1 Tax=Pseudolycoriella hygida TaxID=35572 RepID=A0A9Q0RY92_9DIPT|nr:Mitochondrial outer membrane protein SLC25A46 [Pseudolycoriella hygida]